MEKDESLTRRNETKADPVPRDHRDAVMTLSIVSIDRANTDDVGEKIGFCVCASVASCEQWPRLRLWRPSR